MLREHQANSNRIRLMYSQEYEAPYEQRVNKSEVLKTLLAIGNRHDKHVHSKQLKNC